MKKFEYELDMITKGDLLDSSVRFNDRGKKGWEVINIVHDGLIYVYWKREIKKSVDMGSR